jgi:hypothetical protein
MRYGYLFNFYTRKKRRKNILKTELSYNNSVITKLTLKIYKAKEHWCFLLSSLTYTVLAAILKIF